MSLLVTSEILGLFIYTLTADDKYSLPKKENLPKPIQIHLSQKKAIFHFFAPFLKSRSVFEHFSIKIWPSWLTYFRYKKLWKTWLIKYLKSPFREHPSTVNTLKSNKGFWSLHDSTFIIFFSSICTKLSRKLFLLMISEILGLFFQTLTADGKIPVRNRDNLLQPSPMQFSKK